MRNYKKVLWVGVVLLVSACTRISTERTDNNPISKYLISDKNVNSTLNAKLDINQKSSKCLKVIISRRNSFLRVTVFQIINKEELSEVPSSYFKFYNNTFLCYDGSEILRNKHVGDGIIDSLKSQMKTDHINDSPVFQLDIADNGTKIKINDPAVNPYDFNEKAISDTVNFSKRK